MANNTNTLSKSRPSEPSMDAALLQEKGLKFIQDKIGHKWSDHNHHDPGITILEILSYMISELGYRTNFEMQDLLVDHSNSGKIPTDNAFFPAHEILTTQAVTEFDYRKLLIDIQGIENAWIRTTEAQEQNLNFVEVFENIQKLDAKLMYQEDADLQKDPFFAKEYPKSGNSIENEKRIDLKQVGIQGLMDVMLEFSEHEVFGNLNSNYLEKIIPTSIPKSIQILNSEEITLNPGEQLDLKTRGTDFLEFLEVFTAFLWEKLIENFKSDHHVDGQSSVSSDLITLLKNSLSIEVNRNEFESNLDAVINVSPLKQLNPIWRQNLPIDKIEISEEGKSTNYFTHIYKTQVTFDRVEDQEELELNVVWKGEEEHQIWIDSLLKEWTYQVFNQHDVSNIIDSINLGNNEELSTLLFQEMLEDALQTYIDDGYLKELIEESYDEMVVEFSSTSSAPSTENGPGADFYQFVAFPILDQLKNHQSRRAINSLSEDGILPFLNRRFAYINSLEKKAKDTIHANRNLCEDLNSIYGVEMDEVDVEAEIGFEKGVDVEETMAQVYFEIHKHLSPTMKRYSLEEMMDNDDRVEEIFNGPVLRNGFIDSDELRELDGREKLYTSNISSIITRVEGVRFVSDILLKLRVFREDSGHVFENATNLREGENEVELQNPDYYRPYLRTDLLNLRPESKTEDWDENKVRTRLLQLIQEEKREKKYDESGLILAAPTGEDRKVAEYHSMLDEFPLIYGVGKFGLEDSASAHRKAQAKQLKAFLLFFDQMMTDYLAQLSNVKNLFSISPEIDKTYFAQSLVTEEDPFHLKALFRVLEDETLECGDIIDYDQQPWLDYYKKLRNVFEDASSFEDRRNRFLDHIMGRFSESFEDYSLWRKSQGDPKAAQELIKFKEQFVAKYPKLGYERFKAYDQFELKEGQSNVWNTNNVSGIQKKIAALLGIENVNRRGLSVLKGSTYKNWGYQTVLKQFISIWEENQYLLISPKNYVIESSLQFASIEERDVGVKRLIQLNATQREIEVEKVSFETAIVHVKEGNEYLAKAIIDTSYFWKESKDNLANYWQKDCVLTEQQRVLLEKEITNEIEKYLDEELKNGLGINQEKFDASSILINEKAFGFRNSNERLILIGTTQSSDEIVLDNAIRRVIERAKLFANYRRVYDFNQPFGYDLKEDNNATIAKTILPVRDADNSIFFDDSLTEVELRKFCWFLNQAQEVEPYSGEGFFLLENVLLRPRIYRTIQGVEQKDDLLMNSISEEDPYSFIVTLILPMWHKRFGDEAFQRFLEEKLKEELPAHIIPEFIWVKNMHAMRDFETAYKKWLHYHSLLFNHDSEEQDVIDREKSNSLNHLLQKIKDLNEAKGIGKMMIGDCTPEIQLKDLFDQKKEWNSLLSLIGEGNPYEPLRSNFENYVAIREDITQFDKAEKIKANLIYYFTKFEPLAESNQYESNVVGSSTWEELMSAMNITDPSVNLFTAYQLYKNGEYNSNRKTISKIWDGILHYFLLINQDRIEHLENDLDDSFVIKSYVHSNNGIEEWQLENDLEVQKNREHPGIDDGTLEYNWTIQ